MRTNELESLISERGSLLSKPNEDKVDWRQKGNCNNKDPELFFPIGRGSLIDLQVEQAKELCEPCPVRSECLIFSLKTKDTWDGSKRYEEFGIWGGFDEDQRRGLRRLSNNPRTFKPKFRGKSSSEGESAA
jgi:WhiB family transcriptional regulator, redox-sensing transcriptional regulator